jgi:hypothetical protein
MLWGTAAVLAVCSAGLGCAQSAQTIRGQSPVTAEGTPLDGIPLGPFVGSAPGYGEHSHSHHKDFKTLPQFRNGNFGFEGGYYTGPEGYYTEHRKHSYSYGGMNGGCPHCQYGMACPPAGCPECGHTCPQHHNTYEYHWPKNLVYPSPVVPAGMVQWPYYTLRGPTDFFMK